MDIIKKKMIIDFLLIVIIKWMNAEKMNSEKIKPLGRSIVLGCIFFIITLRYKKDFAPVAVFTPAIPIALFSIYGFTSGFFRAGSFAHHKKFKLLPKFVQIFQEIS